MYQTLNTMNITVTKITSMDEAKEFIEASVNGEFHSKIKDLKRLYLSEHSPMYTQIFKLELRSIPSYVSTHIRTHKSHFISEVVTTNRKDRGGSPDAGRMTTVDMIILCNAKTPVDMCKKRLCSNADSICREVFTRVKSEVASVDPDLARFLVPQCIYRGGICPEWRCCGYIHTEKFRERLINYLSGFESNYYIDNLSHKIYE